MSDTRRNGGYFFDCEVGLAQRLEGFLAPRSSVEQRVT